MRLSGTKTSKVQQRGLGSQLYDVAGVRPTLDLDFAGSKSLVDRASNKDKVTFTRGSSGTYVGSDGLIQSAAVDTARFDHDPITGESLGLLVEEARTNLLPNSEIITVGGGFSNSIGSWSSIVENILTAPDGASTAELYIEASNTVEHTFFRQQINAPTSLVQSIYVKPYGGRQYVGLRFFNIGNDWAAVTFDMVHKTVTDTQLGPSSGFTVVGSGIEDAGNGWSRIWAAVTQPASQSSYNFVFNGVTSAVPTLNTSGSEEYTGDTSKGYYVWGAQLEEGAFPTSYIPTAGSTVTRAADVAKITGTNFSSWYNQTEGSVFVSYNKPWSGNWRSYRGFFTVSDSAAAGDEWIGWGNTNGNGTVDEVYWSIQVGNVGQLQYTAYNAPGPGKYSHAIAVATNNASYARGGQILSNDTSVTLPIVDQAVFGATNTHLSRITYWPERLPDSTLQDITKPTPAYERYSLRLDQQFAATKSLVNDVTGTNLIDFTRASTGTYVDSDGLIKTAPSGAPRFDHDPVTGESLGLLIEENRTNLVESSEDLSIKWTASNSTVTFDPSVIAPDGSSGAWVGAVNGTGVSVRIQPLAVAYTSGSDYTISVFCKAKEVDTVAVFFNEADFGFTASSSFVNLSTGAVTGITDIGVTSFPNGWYRISVTTTALVSDTGRTLAIAPGSTGNVNNLTGNGVDGVYIWGAQLEEGSFPTSYIPTEGSTVTRAADIAEITGTNFTSFYNQTEGSVFVENDSKAVYVGADRFDYLCQFELAGSGGTDRIAIENGTLSSGQRYLLSVVDSGVTQVSSQLASALSENITRNVAVCYASNDCAGTVNGGAVATDTSATIPITLNKFRIGSGTGGTLSGHISRLSYWTERLDNDQLIEITS